MSLPWVRLDTNLAGHDKILELTAEKDGYRAAFSYVCSIGYAGGNGTDGLITFATLPFIHGNKRTAELCVKHFLWAPDPLGWLIVNFEKRQQSAAVTRQISNARRVAANKGNCVRWHGPNCKCWEATG